MPGVIAALVIYGVLAWSFRGFTADDTFIFARFAEHLVAGHGLVFNPGERVQGFTSPLWTLLVAAAAWAGLPTIAFAKVAGAALGAGCIVLAAMVGRHIDQRAGVIAPIVLAGFLDLPYWAVSGMDAPLFAFVVALALWVTISAAAGGPMAAAGIAWGIAGITRPEGVMFGLIAMTWLLHRRRGTHGGSVLPWAMFVMPLVAWAIFAWSFYGDPLPNTYYAKRFDHGLAFWRGLVYLRSFLTANDVALMAAAIVAAWWHGSRAILTLFAGLLAAFVSYVLWTGGDSWVAPGVFRFATPMLVPLSVALAAGASEAWTRFALPPAFGRIPALIIAAAWLSFPSADHLVLYEVGGDTRMVEHMKAHAGPNDALAVTDAGQFAWRTGLTTIDTYGLSDAYIGRLRKRTNGEFRPGEDLKLVDYLMERAPRWIILKGTLAADGPHVINETGAPAIAADVRFRRDYRFVMSGIREPYLLFERTAASAR